MKKLKVIKNKKKRKKSLIFHIYNASKFLYNIYTSFSIHIFTMANIIAECNEQQFLTNIPNQSISFANVSQSNTFLNNSDNNDINKVPNNNNNNNTNNISNDNIAGKNAQNPDNNVSKNEKNEKDKVVETSHNIIDNIDDNNINNITNNNTNNNNNTDNNNNNDKKDIFVFGVNKKRKLEHNNNNKNSTLKSKKSREENIPFICSSNFTLSYPHSKDNLIFKRIARFFLERLEGKRDLQTLIHIKNRKGPISLRIIEYLVTNYAKKYEIVYWLKSENDYFNLYENYKHELKCHSKKHFDPFCRGDKKFTFGFPNDDECKVKTSLRQLNFFKWAIINGVIEYAQNNIKDIYEDMSRDKMSRQQPKKRRRNRKMKELFCKLSIETNGGIISPTTINIEKCQKNCSAMTNCKFYKKKVVVNFN